MSDPKTRGTLAVALVVVLGACGPGDDATEEAPPAEPPSAAEPAAPQLPDTTADAVWAYLEAQDYRSWPMWPGTQALYAGTEPHGMLLSTFANERAMEALRAGEPGNVPDGSIVVKENFTPDSALAAVTVMYKVDGYDPDNADWWYLKRLADGTVEASGRVPGCTSCHGTAPGGDWFHTELPGDDEAAADSAAGAEPQEDGTGA